MKTLNNTIAAAALLFAIAGNASAAVNSTLERDVQWAAGGNSNITYEIDGDTITLSGQVENERILNNIIKAAEANGARAVVDNVVSLAERRSKYVAVATQ